MDSCAGRAVGVSESISRSTCVVWWAPRSLHEPTWVERACHNRGTGLAKNALESNPLLEKDAPDTQLSRARTNPKLSTSAR